MEFGQHWSSWENTLASIASDGISARAPADYARTFARLENHYFINNGFLEEKDAILNNMDKIENIPGNIVQGRFDMICPPTSAFKLFEKSIYITKFLHFKYAKNIYCLLYTSPSQRH